MKIEQKNTRQIKLNKLEPGEVFRKPKGECLYMVMKDYNGVFPKISYVNIENGNFGFYCGEKPVVKVNCKVIIEGDY